ncbi:hypothetical protein RF640_14275 [Kocuria sp. CPCC 205231]|uniref:hypothetical protein n=1 Tax=Kocuria sp. CPCC 205231 TaxID=3073551 RepID=UPI0034D77F3F
MKELADVLGPLLTTVASVAGVLGALGQLTAGTRLRRQVAYWQEQAQVSVSTQDRAVAQSLQREAMGRLVALQAIPGRRLLIEGAMVVFLLAWATGQCFQVAADLAEQLSARRLIENHLWEIGVVMLLLLLICRGVSRTANAVYERRQIATAYILGTALEREHLKAFRGGQTHTTLGWKGLGLLVVIAGGLWCLAVFLGLGLGAGSQGVEQGPAWLSNIALGSFLGLAGLVALYVLDLHHAGWKHPSPELMEPTNAQPLNDDISPKAPSQTPTRPEEKKHSRPWLTSPARTPVETNHSHGPGTHGHRVNDQPL